jgi:hypothetical protein
MSGMVDTIIPVGFVGCLCTFWRPNFVLLPGGSVIAHRIWLFRRFPNNLNNITRLVTIELIGNLEFLKDVLDGLSLSRIRTQELDMGLAFRGTVERIDHSELVLSTSISSGASAQLSLGISRARSRKRRRGIRRCPAARSSGSHSRGCFCTSPISSCWTKRPPRSMRKVRTR